jgi:Asp-tRNA(Asn)/Glu-tRNA(Gln) amidotransferase A subunit family amidase
VPIGVKDIFNTADMPTQMGSPIWKGFTPGNDARVVHYLRMADGIILGKTVTAEFAVHAPGPTRNPHNLDYMPGTSSSGSAASVAASMVPVALGTQTAGSIIRPASYCGVYGFKPSFGLVPRTAMLKTTDSLDTVGFFTRSVDDLALVFDVIRVHGRDYPIVHKTLNDPARQTKGDRPWRVGLLKGPKWTDAEPYAQSAFENFGNQLGKLAGVTVEPVTLPESFNRAHQIHATIYDRTLAYYFKEEFAAQTLVSGIMYEIIERGNKLTVKEYTAALGEQNNLSYEIDTVLEGSYDVLLDLSTGGAALKGLASVDRLDNCLIWTLCGLPAINVPVFAGPNGLPFGAQVVARRYNDYLLLDFVRYLRATGLVKNGTQPAPRMDFAA